MVLPYFASSNGSVNLDVLSLSVGSLPPIFYEVLEPWKRYRTVERPWLYDVIGRLVQRRILDHCYPKLTVFTRSGNPSGRYGLGHGFTSLLGAAWLQMARSLDDNVGQNATYCKLPDCGRRITVEPGQPAPDGEGKDADGNWKRTFAEHTKPARI